MVLISHYYKNQSNNYPLCITLIISIGKFQELELLDQNYVSYLRPFTHTVKSLLRRIYKFILPPAGHVVILTYFFIHH